MKIIIVCTFCLIYLSLNSQPNCEAYKYYYKDTIKYKACTKSLEALELYQFTKEYQAILDEAIAIDPTFAFAYRKKSTAYLKSGDFINWKKLMDNAVMHDPKGNLEYRALMRFKCFRDYEGALIDFERMKVLEMATDHLSVPIAMCYEGLDMFDKAIDLLSKAAQIDSNHLGLTGYLHFGVIYLKSKQYQKAINCFAKQNEINEISEAYYYKAKCEIIIGNSADAKQSLSKSRLLYLDRKSLFDDYIEPIHKIYLNEIDSELKNLAQ